MYDYNFFSTYKSKHSSKSNKGGSVLIIIFLGTLLVLGGAISWIRYDLNGLKDEIDGLKATIQLPANQEMMIRYDSKQAILSELETQVSQLTASEALLVSEDRIQQPLMDGLVEALPVDAQVNDLMITSELITLSGLAAQRSAIAEYQYSLRQLPMVYDVFVSQIGTTEESFSFSMTIQIGGDDNENLD